MNVIIDTNILISALIKDSLTRKLITLSKNKFLYPEIALEEIEKYKQEILKKSKLTDVEYETLLSRLFNHVSLIRTKKLETKLKQAEEIMSKIDQDRP